MPNGDIDILKENERTHNYEIAYHKEWSQDKTDKGIIELKENLLEAFEVWLQMGAKPTVISSFIFYEDEEENEYVTKVRRTRSKKSN